MEPDKLEPIAVVGLSCRLPQDATSPETFWKMLCDGVSAVTEIPRERFNPDAFYHPDHNRVDAVNTRRAHLVKGDVAAFDAPFFGISREEASVIDPQQRGLLEVTYRALESGGIPIEQIAGTRASVYTASFARDHDTLLTIDPQAQSKYHLMGVTGTMLANRISHFYDLRGPSMALDTACSSSLYALHLACQSLRSGESTSSIVGGSNLILSPETMMQPLSNAGILSQEGRSYSFDHRANGYARGEGVAVVVLKRLNDAIKDGNVIRCIIRSTAVSHDGKTPSLTAPSTAAQEALINETYLNGGLDLAKTQFIEAHGTGTQVGDPIEARIIGRTFRDSRGSNGPLMVGAVKSNIGHLEGASGLAALIKVIMSLEHGIVPPNIWFEKPNSAIDIDDLRLQFPTKPTLWPTKGVRQASISNFGYGGSNAHVVVQDAFYYLSERKLQGIHETVEHPRIPDSKHQVNGDGAGSDSYGQNINGEYVNVNSMNGNHLNFDVANDAHAKKELPNSSMNNAAAVNSNRAPSTRSKLLLFSATDEQGPVRQAEALQEHFADKVSSGTSYNYLDDTAYTLSEKRSLLPWRAFIVVSSIDDVACGLSRRLSRAVRPSRSPEISFIFTGQGAQWVGMGRELLAYPVFRQSLETADTYLSKIDSNWSLLSALFDENMTSRLNSPALSQPVCTCLQIALVELLASWNIEPTSVIGHSSGEIAAAYCARALSKESAWKVAFYRGLLSERLAQDTNHQPKAMMAVALSADDVLARLRKLDLDSSVFVGCLNSPINTTVTGLQQSIDTLKSALEEERIFAKKLAVNVAYHSKYMTQVSEQYDRLISTITRPPASATTRHEIIVYSSVTGREIAPEKMSQSSYWVDNLLSKVDFVNALRSLVAQKKSRSEAALVFIEVGPHAALRRPTQETLDASPAKGRLIYTSALRQNVAGDISALELAGALSTQGYKANMLAVNRLDIRDSHPKTLVNLPQYPFRTQLYWFESRLFKAYRQRAHGRHDLLGTPVMDWNALEPRWRNIIRMKEMPWVKDHGFNGAAVYPAGGLLVMAIEAARQLVDPAQRISGYRLTHVSYLKPLILSEESVGTEVSIHLRPQPDPANPPCPGYDFCIFGWNDTESVHLCRGTVQAEVIQLGVDSQLDNAQHYKNVNKCILDVHHDQFYENLENIGFHYGPTFRLLRSIKYSKSGEAYATMCPQDWKNNEEAKYAQSCVIHPTILDSALHLPIAGFSEGGWKSIPTLVASSTSEVWVSNDLFEKTGNLELKVSSNIVFRGYREMDCSIYALDTETETPILSIARHRATATGSFESPMANDRRLKQLAYTIGWKPDLSLLTNIEAQRYLQEHLKGVEYLSRESIDISEALAVHFVAAAMPSVPSKPYTGNRAYLNHYIEWMHRNLQGSEEQPSSYLRSDDKIQKMLNTEPQNALVQMIMDVGKNLTGILNGSVNALELLFQGTLAEDYYRITSRSSAECFASYLDVLSHGNPALRILEIGAGTGSTTVEVLRALNYYVGNGETAPRFTEYVFTDMSPAFFEKAKERFSLHVNSMLFKPLDIGASPEAQGFELGTFDVVIAGSVLHATPNLHVTLSNVRKLLKPGGKLMMAEQCNMARATDKFVFGVLPGWWLSEEPYRSNTPLISEERWNQLLKESGFSGTDLVIRDSQDAKYHNLSALISTANEEKSSKLQLIPILIVADRDSAFQYSVAKKLQAAVRDWSTAPCELLSLAQIEHQDLQKALVVCLLELEEDLLDNVTEATWTTVKTMCLTAKQLLWVTEGAGLHPKRPEVSKVTGLSRSVCSERGQQLFHTLTVENSCTGPNVVDFTFRVLKKVLTSDDPQLESEFVEASGMIHVGRAVPDGALNDAIELGISRRGQIVEKIGEHPKRPLRLTIDSPGLLDTLHFFEDDCMSRSLGDDEVEVEVFAASLNFKDILVALGQIASDYFGSDAAGVVRRAGAKAPFQPGDRVVCQTVRTLATYLRCSSLEVQQMPEGTSFEETSTIAVFTTAYYSLITIGRLRKGESVLIHSGAGGVGQAAIQIAMLVGAEIFVTVGNTDKKQLLINDYDIAPGRIFSSRDTSFTKGVLQATSGRGVDIVLNSLTGELLRQSFELLAPFGRFVEIGKRDIYANHKLSMAPFARNITFASVDLDAIVRESKPLLQQILSECMAFIRKHTDGFKAPQPVHVFPASRVEAAFRFLQSGANAGKTVVTFGHDDEVQFVPGNKRPRGFASDATYVIAGGLGGLGRSIVRWMSSRGAKNFFLPSRSDYSSSSSVLAFLQEMKDKGIQVEAPICDVSDVDLLKCALAQCQATLPPIKGCIQASMMLKDGLFENMTREDFQAAVAPKVAGSWNLHRCLPKDLDFFILLSSIAGVTGSPGQSNYAAANVYQDTLARYRVANGQKCIALNLGLMLGVGYAAENAPIAKSMRAAGNTGLREDQFLATLDLVCDPARPLASPESCQIIIGMDTPESFRLNGQDELPAWIGRPLFRNLHQISTPQGAATKDTFKDIDYLALVQAAESVEEAGDIIKQAFVKKLARTLSLTEQEIDANKPAYTLGVDSLLAVEVRHWFLKELKAEVTVFNVLGERSITEFCLSVAGDVTGSK